MNEFNAWYDLLEENKIYYKLMSYYIPVKIKDNRVFFNSTELKKAEQLLIRFSSKRIDIISRLLNAKQRKQKIERVLNGTY
jgi:hypothetical protein